jgi:DNA modification methylase
MLIDKIMLYPNNPRKISASAMALLKESIRRDPAFMRLRPIVVDKNGVILGGNQRYRAICELGMSEIPDEWVVRADDLTDEQRRRFVIVDNAPEGMSGEWDTELLAVDWADLKLDSFGLEGIPLSELDNEQNDPDEIPEAPETLVSKPGDIWLLGEHRLMCGSAVDKKNVSALLAGRCPEIMITDPPYGVSYDATWRCNKKGLGNNKSTLAIGAVCNDDRASWAAAFALFPGDVLYVWHASELTATAHMAITSCGFEVRAQIIWAKNNFAISRGHYHRRHDPCFYAVRKGATGSWGGGRKQSTLWADIIDTFSMRKKNDPFFAAKMDFETIYAFDGRLTTVWEIPKPQKSETGHSTQKPVECMSRPIKNHNIDSVYEPFCGSGTTIIACEQLNRKCFAMEIEPRYVDVAVRRWEKFTGKTAVLSK